MSFSSVPLGHKFIAVLLAAAVGGGVYAWFRHDNAEKASTAELSFDMHTARRVDPGFIQAREPAVAFAQSILTDQKIAELSKAAYLSTSGMMSRIGEFRSRLQLTQPVGQELHVSFRDADAEKAAAMANVVANALTTWTPSPDGPAALTEPTPAAPAATRQSPPKQAAPAAKAPVARARAPARPASRPEAAQEASGLASALGGLHEQLSSANARVEQLASGEGSRGRAYAESEEQQVLRSEIRTAEQKVADLRSHSTDGDRQRLGSIQASLAEVLSGGGVGVSASRLRHERNGLERSIDVVEEQRAAMQKEESAAGAQSPTETPAGSGRDASGTEPAPAAATTTGSDSGSGPITENNLPGAGSAGTSSAGAGPGGAVQGASSAAPEPSPMDSGSGNPDAAMLDPLHIARLAGPAGPVEWWPAAAAGVLCGLLYLLIASARQPRYDDYETEVEASPSYGRFITPDAPAPAVVERAPVEEAAPPVGLFERGSQKRASFMYEPTPGVLGVMGGSAAEVTSRVETKDRGVANEPAAVSEAQGAIAQENVVKMDPWADLMEKALSETEIGRRFNTPHGDGAKKKEDEPRPGRPDRLAG